MAEEPADGPGRRSTPASGSGLESTPARPRLHSPQLTQLFKRQVEGEHATLTRTSITYSLRQEGELALHCYHRQQKSCQDGHAGRRMQSVRLSSDCMNQLHCALRHCALCVALRIVHCALRCALCTVHCVVHCALWCTLQAPHVILCGSLAATSVEFQRLGFCWQTGCRSRVNTTSHSMKSAPARHNKGRLYCRLNMWRVPPGMHIRLGTGIMQHSKFP